MGEAKRRQEYKARTGEDWSRSAPAYTPRLERGHDATTLDSVSPLTAGLHSLPFFDDAPIVPPEEWPPHFREAVQQLRDAGEQPYVVRRADGQLAIRTAPEFHFN